MFGLVRHLLKGFCRGYILDQLRMMARRPGNHPPFPSGVPCPGGPPGRPRPEMRTQQLALRPAHHPLSAQLLGHRVQVAGRFWKTFVKLYITKIKTKNCYEHLTASLLYITHGQCGPSIITIVIITPSPPPLSSSSCVNKRRRQGRGEHPTPPAGIGKSYPPVFPNGFFNGLATFFPIGVFSWGSRPTSYLSSTQQRSVHI